MHRHLFGSPACLCLCALFTSKGQADLSRTDIFSNAATFGKAGCRRTGYFVRPSPYYGQKNVLMTQRTWVDGLKHQRNARFLNDNVLSGVTGVSDAGCSGADAELSHMHLFLPGALAWKERVKGGPERTGVLQEYIWLQPRASVCRSHVPTSVFLLYFQIQPLRHRLLPR